MDMRAAKLDDDILENVASGVERVRYSDADFRKAGVTINNNNGNKVYTTTMNGKTINVSESVALGMCDCYKLSGGTRLTDQQLKDLISQS